MYGQRIKELRMLKGLTQGELAKLIDFKSASAIGMIEREEREISLGSLSELATIFKVSTDYLLGKTDTPTALIVKNDEIPDVMKPFLKSNSEMTIELEEDNFGTVEERKAAIEVALKEMNTYDYTSELSKLLELLPESKKEKPLSVYDLYYIIGNDKLMMGKLHSDEMVQESSATYVINNMPHHIEAVKTIPSEFTNSNEARDYISMHQIFASEGFNIERMSDDDVLEFGNEMLKQVELMSYKIKNK